MLKLYARPNVGSYTESIKYRTKIFEAVSGLRDTEPMLADFRYTVKYTAFIFFTSKHRAFINLFRQGLTTTVLAPLWGQVARITDTLTATTTIPCIHKDIMFVEGAEVFITAGYDKFNVVTLLSINTDSLIIDTPVDILEGTIVIPSFVGIVTGEINTTYSGENYEACEIKIEELK